MADAHPYPLTLTHHPQSPLKGLPPPPPTDAPAHLSSPLLHITIHSVVYLKPFMTLQLHQRQSKKRFKPRTVTGAAGYPETLFRCAGIELVLAECFGDGYGKTPLGRDSHGLTRKHLISERNLLHHPTTPSHALHHSTFPSSARLPPYLPPFLPFIPPSP